MKLQLVFDEKPRRGGGSGASGRIAKTLYQQGMDVSSLIYDESLVLITQGDFFSAANRLRMLYSLNPTDSEALLLLSKTLAARKQWQEAKHYLKKAEEKGNKIPSTVRDFIEQGLQRELQNADIERKKALQRDRKEIKLLKKELRKIRGINSSLNNENNNLAEKVNYLCYVCTIVSAVSCAFCLFFWFNNDKETTQKTSTVQTTEVDTQKTKKSEQTNNPSIKAPPQPLVEQQEPPSQPEAAVEVETITPPQPTVTPIEKPQPATKYPIVHIVKRGESLSKIAERYYGDYKMWKRLSDHNNIAPNKIKIKQKIEIPAP